VKCHFSRKYYLLANNALLFILVRYSKNIKLLLNIEADRTLMHPTARLKYVFKLTDLIVL